MPLKTDYKNDVLDTSKNTKRKYQMTENSDGTVSLDDVTVYSQEGSLLGANDINATNEAVNSINIYVGEDKKLHFVNGDGADSVLPFSGGARYSINYNSVTTSSPPQLRVTVFDYMSKTTVFTQTYTGTNMWAQTITTDWFKIGYSTVTNASWTITPIGTADRAGKPMTARTWNYSGYVDDWWTMY